MKKLMTIGLCLVVCSLNGTREDNIMVLLRQRETHGHANKRKIKNAAAACKHPDLVAKLSAIDTPDDFILSIPKEYIARDEASFEDNLLMDIIPAALVNATQEFKDELLVKALRLFSGDAFHKCLCVGLIEAGSNPNSPLQSLNFIRGDESVQDDYAFAQALLDRGANPNNLSWAGDYGDTHTELHFISGLKLAKLLVNYGADPKAISSRLKKTFLHVVAENHCHSPELLQFYIDNGVDVNAKDSSGLTALEYLYSAPLCQDQF